MQFHEPTNCYARSPSSVHHHDCHRLEAKNNSVQLQGFPLPGSAFFAVSRCVRSTRILCTINTETPMNSKRFGVFLWPPTGKAWHLVREARKHGTAIFWRGCILCSRVSQTHRSPIRGEDGNFAGPLSSQGPFPPVVGRLGGWSVLTDLSCLLAKARALLPLDLWEGCTCP